MSCIGSGLCSGGWGGVNQSCIRVFASSLATWAVKQLGSETVGHLVTNASAWLLSMAAYWYHMHKLFKVVSITFKVVRTTF